MFAVGLSAAAIAAGDREQTGQHQTSDRGMVVSVCPLASDQGRDVLKRGGNAVDAAVATAFTLAVTWPEAGNIGGGGFMLVHSTNTREPVVIDYREMAPAAATPTSLAGPDVSEYLLVGVPGTVAGLALAHEKFGSLPWRELVLPAARLAERGFPVDAPLAASLNKVIASRVPDEFRHEYGNNDGRDPWKPGDRLVLADLAKTLGRIADRGRADFYQGETAQLIVAQMKSGGGLITAADLLNYRARLRQPVHGTYRGYHIYGPPPPSSGGIALVEMLNILENFSFRPDTRYAPRTLHLLIESMRRAYRDRAAHLGDSDFVPIPDHLTSKPYARDLAATIDLNHATPSKSLAGDIPLTDEPSHTTHFSIVDQHRMAVSNTYTLEEAYGSRIVVNRAGFLLNNEMGDFNRRPGVTNTAGAIGTPANQIAPGKRMLSSMTPVVVTAPDGRLSLVTGSPGGRTIINTVAQVLLNFVEFGASPADAVRAPRLHQAWLPDSVRVEPELLQDHAEAVDELRRMGHAIAPKADKQGDAHTIWIDPGSGTIHGVADPRRGGAARGL